MPQGRTTDNFVHLRVPNIHRSVSTQRPRLDIPRGGRRVWATFASSAMLVASVGVQTRNPELHTPMHYQLHRPMHYQVSYSASKEIIHQISVWLLCTREDRRWRAKRGGVEGNTCTVGRKIYVQHYLIYCDRRCTIMVISSGEFVSARASVSRVLFTEFHESEWLSRYLTPLCYLTITATQQWWSESKRIQGSFAKVPVFFSHYIF